MKKLFVFALIVIGLAAINNASADNVRGIDIDFVTIGNAGNGTDPATGNLYGAVSSSYRIGKYEITAAQWQTINTAAGIGDSGDWSGNQPVAGISWYSAARFCNYLTSGDKNLGAYQLGTDGSITVDRALAISIYGTIYVIPTEDEWYKAAYFKHDGSGYSLYANGTSTLPVAGVNSNYNDVIGSPWTITNGTPEQNGTFDMMGNVWEWNETLIFGSSRGIRGGAYASYDFGADFFASSYRDSSDSVPLYYEYSNLGFRVASVSKPAIEALVDINPDSLNKNSKGQWITAYITLPAGFDVNKIDVKTIEITSLTGASCNPDYNQMADLSFTPQIGDRDEDGIVDLTVKFSRQELIANLCLDDVAVTVEWNLVTGKKFKGTDHIRVLDREK